MKTKTKLSDDQIGQACLLWMHSIDDRRIAASIGVSYKVLRERLDDDPIQTRVITIMGCPMSITASLSALKIRFKQLCEPSYIQKLHQLTESAELGEDFKTAATNIRWLMEKLMPEKYGKKEHLHDLPPITINMPQGETIENI
jgi:hypothetical protein